MAMSGFTRVANWLAMLLILITTLTCLRNRPSVQVQMVDRAILLNREA